MRGIARGRLSSRRSSFRGNSTSVAKNSSPDPRKDVRLGQSKSHKQQRRAPPRRNMENLTRVTISPFRSIAIRHISLLHPAMVYCTLSLRCPSCSTTRRTSAVSCTLSSRLSRLSINRNSSTVGSTWTLPDNGIRKKTSSGPLMRSLGTR